MNKKCLIYAHCDAFHIFYDRNLTSDCYTRKYKEPTLSIELNSTNKLEATHMRYYIGHVNPIYIF